MVFSVTHSNQEKRDQKTCPIGMDETLRPLLWQMIDHQSAPITTALFWNAGYMATSACLFESSTELHDTLNFELLVVISSRERLFLTLCHALE